jgi:hypothetical protein
MLAGDAEGGGEAAELAMVTQQSTMPRGKSFERRKEGKAKVRGEQRLVTRLKRENVFFVCRSFQVLSSSFHTYMQHAMDDEVNNHDEPKQH